MITGFFTHLLWIYLLKFIYVFHSRSRMRCWMEIHLFSVENIQFIMNGSPTDGAVKLFSRRFSCVRWVAVNIKFIAEHFNNNNDQILQICVFRLLGPAAHKQIRYIDTYMAMTMICVWIVGKNDFATHVTPQWLYYYFHTSFKYLNSLKFARNFASLSPDICVFLCTSSTTLCIALCVTQLAQNTNVVRFSAVARLTATNTHTHITKSVSFFHFSRKLFCVFTAGFSDRQTTECSHLTNLLLDTIYSNSQFRYFPFC